MIVTAKRAKDIILLLIFVLYIISSYVCQDALLPPKINSILLLVFVGISIFCFMIRAQSYDLNFSKWYSLYILYALVSALLMSNNVFPTLYQMFVILILTFCYSVVINSKDNLEITAVTYVISAVAMGVLIMYYNPVYLFGNINSLEGERLGTEETGNANIFTALMMFSGVFAAWLTLYHRHIVLRIFSLLSFLLILYLMALSGGRKTIIALLVCSLYFVWRKGRIKNKLIAIVSIISIMYLLLYLINNVQWIYDVVGYRFEGLLGFIGGTGESNVSSDDLRKRMMEIGLQGWLEKPIFGHGLDSFKFYNAKVTGHMFYSHNNYVEILYDFGIVGFALYYTFMYKLFKRLTLLPKEYELYSILGIGIIIELLIFDIGGVSYYAHSNMIMLCLATIISYSPKYFKGESY